jgi:predicted dehydrogenase
LKQVNVAVVGAGDWGKNLIRNFYKISNLVGICDNNQIVAEQIALQYQVKNLSWQQILLSREIDAVVIANNRSHYQLTKEALLANKHVFVEKPLAPTVEQAEDLCSLAVQFNKKLMVGHLLQYHPAFIELKKICNNQIVGEIRYVYSNRLAFGKFMPEENVILNFASHDISMMLALMGKPTSVNTFANCFLMNNIVDQATLRLQFSSQQYGHIFVSWFHPVKERKFVVIGSRAMVVFDDLAGWEHKLCIYHHKVDINDNNVVLNNLDPEFVKLENHNEPLFNEATHFIKCIEQNLIPYTDGAESLEVLKIVEQASTSNQLKSKQENLIENSIFAGI